jgi:hypothetical protein
MRPPIKWRIEGYDPESKGWVLHNFFKGSLLQVKEKCGDALLKTKYHGIRFMEVIYKYSSDIYYDSSINIFFFLNEQGEEIECNEQGVEV